MTVPNTPPDPSRAAADATAGTAADAPVDRAPAAAANPYGAPPAYGPPPGLEFAPVRKADPRASLRRLLPELQVGAIMVLVCLLLGLAMAGLWVWLAPKVPLVVDGNRILYGDPEGEQRAGADSVFVLIGLGLGILTALGAFLVTRRRGGGIAVAVGLTVGGLLASLGAWGLGRWLGPSRDLVAQARKVGDGGHFSADLDLGAYGAVLVWPMAAMVVLLALSAAFGKREEDPPPYWAGPYGLPAATDGAPGAGGPPAVAGGAPVDQPHPVDRPGGVEQPLHGAQAHPVEQPFDGRKP
ncbi:hypothetical protein [Kitasatospora sp. NPDC088351]|uniref:hypothetical protein n=1 Tax=unclassified Kitasatospora TaxID=2633591 RepID=UPI00343AD1B0